MEYNPASRVPPLTEPGEMRALQELSFGERLRVARLVAKGEAPREPRMAAAAIELAENLQRKGRAESMLFRWVAIMLILVAVAAGIFAMVKGDVVVMVAMGLVTLTNVGHLVFNPATRPKNVSRSLEASKGIVGERSRQPADV